MEERRNAQLCKFVIQLVSPTLSIRAGTLGRAPFEVTACTSNMGLYFENERHNKCMAACILQTPESILTSTGEEKPVLRLSLRLSQLDDLKIKYVFYITANRIFATIIIIIHCYQQLLLLRLEFLHSFFSCLQRFSIDAY